MLINAADAHHRAQELTGRRLKLIAVQAVVVGALLIVVSMTLLRGEEGNPLFEIVAPGGAQIAVGTAEPDPGADNRGRARSGPGASAGPAGTAPGGPTVPPLGLVPDPAAPADPVRPGVESNDPPGDQYADALARLTQQVQ